VVSLTISGTAFAVPQSHSTVFAPKIVNGRTPALNQNQSIWYADIVRDIRRKKA
jgi:hypothetical protein